MAKPLNEMTLEELWQLFPIVLCEHNDCWSEWYAEEVEELKSFLPEKSGFHHIGSTAVEGIWAKPIVDILIVVEDFKEMQLVAKEMSNHGYIVMSESENRISLNKGYTENGFAEKVFHFHLRLANDVDEIYFRDYLKAHFDIAKEYEALKKGLWKRFEHNRDAYTDAKTEFVRKYTNIAKNEK